MRKRTSKLLAAGLAGVLAAATLLGGTFAWQSISQGATNKVDSAVNPGGRLHDDFDGVNKDVYIENFTPEDGGMPIFARIRLYEYMEKGEDAGTNLEGPDRNVEVVGTTEDGTPDINDPTTWIVHQYDHAETPVEGETTPIHSSIKWQMGGSTVYMPTFNMDKDSLKADINGTFEGPDGLLGTADDVLVVGSEGGLDGEITAAQYVVTITVDDEDAGESITLLPGAKQQLGAKVTLNGQPVEDQAVTWSIASDNSNTGSKVESSGLVTMSNYKQEVKVQATYKYSNTGTDTLTVSVTKLGYGDIDSVSPGSTTTVSIDGYDWYVLVKDDINSDTQTDALILSKNSVLPVGSGMPNGSWVGSDARGLLMTWLDSQKTLKNCGVSVHLYSLTRSMTTWDESDDTVFLLTEADMFGSTGGVPTSERKNYTYAPDGVGKVLVTDPEMRKVDAHEQYLRNFYNGPNSAIVYADGTLRTSFGDISISNFYARPAMWVTIPKSAQ